MPKKISPRASSERYSTPNAAQDFVSSGAAQQ